MSTLFRGCYLLKLQGFRAGITKHLFRLSSPIKQMHLIHLLDFQLVIVRSRANNLSLGFLTQNYFFKQFFRYPLFHSDCLQGSKNSTGLNHSWSWLSLFSLYPTIARGSSSSPYDRQSNSLKAPNQSRTLPSSSAIYRY